MVRKSFSIIHSSGISTSVAAPELCGSSLNLRGKTSSTKTENNYPFREAVGSGSWGTGILNCMMKNRVLNSAAFLVLSVALLASAISAYAQNATRFVGSITAIENKTLTVKTDSGDLRQVAVPATAAIKRIAPGERDLSSAAVLQFSDLATGDRILVKLESEAAAGTVGQASQIVVVKLTDVALKQQKEREDWQKRGVGGLVKSVNAAEGIILLNSGTNGSSKVVTIHVAKTTVLKRYAAGSVSYDTAQAAPIDVIHAGDQLRARGAKSADGSEITAEEVVSGSFRNISGTITSLDASSSILVVKDLATKKQVTIHVSDSTQMRRLPDRMAQMLAAKLKGETSGMGGGGTGGNMQPGVPSGAQTGSGDAQQLLNRAPTIHMADLTKSEAVMLVSTEGTNDVTAITLLAGVQTLLEAPAATDLLSNWSMNTSAGVSNSAQ